jgi:hypothetical protein
MARALNIPVEAWGQAGPSKGAKLARARSSAAPPAGLLAELRSWRKSILAEVARRLDLALEQWPEAREAAQDALRELGMR